MRPNVRWLSLFAIRVVSVVLVALSFFLAPDLQTPTAAGSVSESVLPATNESGTLAYTASAAPCGEKNQITLKLHGANLVLSDSRSGFILCSRPLALTRGVEIKGAGGDTNDTLTVDFSGGPFSLPEGLRFDGGVGGYDTLVVTGGTSAREIYDPKNQNDGVITLDGTRIIYSNIEPVIDTVPAVNFTFNGPASDDLINIVDGGVLGGDALTQVNSSNSPSPTFESIAFSNKTNVIVNSMDGSDTITLNNPNPATGMTTLTINGGNGDDSIIVTAAPPGVTVNIYGDNGTDTFNIMPSSTVTLNITGGLPIPPALPGDLLAVDMSGTINPALSISGTSTGFQGSFAFDNRQPLNFQQIESVPQQATHFSVSAPASATVGSAFNFTVTAQDQFNNTAISYAGALHFTSTDAAAVLPPNSTLINGVGTFAATLQTAGGQTITATDTVNGSITGTSNNIADTVPIPAMTEWGIILMSALLAGTMTYLLRRKKVG